MIDLYNVLAERDMVAQTTDENIKERLESSLSCYIGFDPTADSLHIGSLVPVMGLAHLQRCGHTPIALVGGGTGMIGDPSGKTESRQMLTVDDINHNVSCMGNQLSHFLDFNKEGNPAKLLNNADWLADLSWIDILREAGPHFSINRMLTMDSVKGRMEAGGITFLEFNYMVMQAYDFLYLHEKENCSLQMGGQDQWGNIVMGIELARRKTGASLAGLTMPLVMKSDGGKFGKSEKGNVWLSKDRTPVFEFYQFWRNTADADVDKFLKLFTFLDIDEIRKLSSLKDQAINEAKERLAYEVTNLVHGKDEAEKAMADTRKAFSGAMDVTGDSIPHAKIDATELEEGVGILNLLTRAELAKSNGEARRLVTGKAIRINNKVVEDPTVKITTANIEDSHIVIKCGKKRWFRYDI